ncbi:hypothetical protein [Dokdonia sp. Hel_I_53]|uniref:hypothetical protein n=1 Tax=Dokdonia sp. Hel_I_53 TaxID=1566287 RepID=UPI00119C541C|nr:hypothetical protein [Dokdonia sp. Hel_I_53]TVZ52373.1 tissue inhibitor of metalloproteinase [Dokdonia sp. Hel_I_53]
MKQILQITLFLFSIGVFACDCMPPNLTEKYSKSDLVARVKIVKNYSNEGSEELYRADIIIQELFKGKKTESIFIAGRSDGNMGSSCAMFIPENTELIIYTSKNDNGNYVVGMCSGLLQFYDWNIRKQKKELDILRTLKSKDIHFTNKISFRNESNLAQQLKQFSGIELEKKYGIYEIVFTSDLGIKNINMIVGFDNPVDSKLIKIIEDSNWASFDRKVKNKVPENSKLLVIIFYYEQQKANLSFLSQHHL